MPFARVHTQIFRYLSVGQAFTPPVAEDFTESSVPKDALVVFVRVMPVVGLPFGSFVARANWTLTSDTRPFQTGGTLDLSVFLAR